jgi:hypothetical protein
MKLVLYFCVFNVAYILPSQPLKIKLFYHILAYIGQLRMKSGHMFYNEIAAVCVESVGHT